MELPTFILSVLALVAIVLMAGLMMRKNIKSFKISFSFFKGFEFSGSFYEETKK